jgi:site-specific DNA-methyltransferase (adenine-specific)
MLRYGGQNSRPWQEGHINSDAEHLGRWPANLLLDEESAAMLDEQSGVTASGAMRREVGAYPGESHTDLLRGKSGPSNQHGDSGGASRFFYCAKASRSERGEGNTHPTVKPQKLDTELARYLLTLVLPPARENEPRLLVPFCGSGSELLGARAAGWECILGIDISPEYAAIARSRLSEPLDKAA